MKKPLFVLIMMLCCIGVNAQRVAVLDFNAGVGVSQADVDGISAIFNTYFSPRGYTLVERTQIDKAIDEQNFQRGKFTESQMVRIGQILNVSNVVVGDIKIFAGRKYDVYVRVINVQSGTIQAEERAFGTSYGNMMKGIAEKLANKIAINPVAPTLKAEAEQEAERERQEYARTHGSSNGHDWVDLGLSVKWATCNVGATSPEEYGDYFAWGETTTKSSYTESNSKTYGMSIDIKGNSSYDAATANCGGAWRMPTYDEWEELRNRCTWKNTKQNGVDGYKVTGPNDNSIFIPAAGYSYGSSLKDDGIYGYYWSSTPYGNSNDAYSLFFTSGYSSRNHNRHYFGLSVRPVLE